MAETTQAVWLGFVAATIHMATPLLLAALGEIFAERAGLLNIALEGMMLFGAFGGFVLSHQSGSPWVGLLAAMVAAALVALVFGLLTISLGGDQVVVGIALNLIVVGLASFMYRVLYGVSIIPVVATGFTPVRIPLLAAIPVIGPVLFAQSPMPYIAVLLLPVVNWALWRTRWGLRLRACGENPVAAQAEGVAVKAYRYAGILLCGVLAGAGGAVLSLEQLNVYAENITAGRGFIALAVVIFGRWRPVGAAIAAVLFGAADALALIFQVGGVAVSHFLLLMLPYVLTVVALVGLGGAGAAPAALGKQLER